MKIWELEGLIFLDGLKLRFDCLLINKKTSRNIRRFVYLHSVYGSYSEKGQRFFDGLRGKIR